MTSTTRVSSWIVAAVEVRAQVVEVAFRFDHRQELIGITLSVRIAFLETPNLANGAAR
ncbi:MAG: hypothetical protein WDO18_14045 [Acidobacteriota bacterium]